MVILRHNASGLPGPFRIFGCFVHAIATDSRRRKGNRAGFDPFRGQMRLLPKQYWQQSVLELCFLIYLLFLSFPVLVNVQHLKVCLLKLQEGRATIHSLELLNLSNTALIRANTSVTF